jgi:hypothetical protein
MVLSATVVTCGTTHRSNLNKIVIRSANVEPIRFGVRRNVDLGCIKIIVLSMFLKNNVTKNPNLKRREKDENRF